MSQRLLSALIVIGSAVTCFALEPPATKAKIESAGWLAGTWETNEPGQMVTEHWMTPAGGTMLGMSRTVARNRTMEHEFLRLREEEDGGLSYVATPSRQPEATFRLTKATPTELTFENPAHDFPQRIHYKLKNATNLLAAVEGTKNGKTSRVEFNYTRTNPR